MTTRPRSASIDAPSNPGGQQPPMRGVIDLSLREQWKAWLRSARRQYWQWAIVAGVILEGTIAAAWHFQTFQLVHVLGIVAGIVCGAIGWRCLGREDHPIVRWDCHACGKRLTTDASWICGSCDYENHSYTHSFLHQCRSCTATPAGYLCQHCGEPTWFVANPDTRLPARIVPEPRPGETSEQARTRREQEIAEKQHHIDRLRHETEIRNLTQQLERVSNPPVPVDGDTALKQQLARALKRLKINMRAVARSKQLQDQVDCEIVVNKARLSDEEVQRLRAYAQRQFDAYREDIALGRYDH